MENKIKIFEETLLKTKRDGIGDLINFIRKAKFYEQPASTRFHSCHSGGLLEHSLNVWDCLKDKKYNSVAWKDNLKDVSDETIAIVALLHDLGKLYQYEIEMRNRKDDDGNWVKVPFYTVNDKYPIPHSTKSIVFATQFIKLSIEETSAIVSHMGFSDAKDYYNAIGGSFRKYPLCLALHEADLEATYLMEEEA